LNVQLVKPMLKRPINEI